MLPELAASIGAGAPGKILQLRRQAGLLRKRRRRWLCGDEIGLGCRRAVLWRGDIPSMKFAVFVDGSRLSSIKRETNDNANLSIIIVKRQGIRADRADHRRDENRQSNGSDECRARRIFPVGEDRTGGRSRSFDSLWRHTFFLDWRQCRRRVERVRRRLNGFVATSGAGVCAGASAGDVTGMVSPESRLSCTSATSRMEICMSQYLFR